MRIRLRDRDALPVLDANEEAGHTLAIAVPDSWVDGAIVERPEAGGAGAPLQTFAVPAPVGDADLSLASLQPMDARGAARGPAEIFESLFHRPFGPRALAQYAIETRTAPPDVYGVSREDAERMDLLLGQIESAERGQRLFQGTIGVGVGAVLGVVGASLLYYDRNLGRSDDRIAEVGGGLYVGLGALSLGVGAYTLSLPGAGERAASEYRALLQNGTDYARAFAAAETRLRALSEREAQRRAIRRSLGVVVALVFAGGLAYSEVTATSPTQRLVGRAIGGSGVLLGATLVAGSYLIESPIERLTTIWERDPGMLHLQPVVSPVAGGAMLGLTGRF
jgi:hypothetical protein